MELTTSPFLPVCSLSSTRNENHGLLRKVTILHLAVFIYCISVFFVCIVKSHIINNVVM